MAKFVAEISANINEFVSKLREAQGKAEKFASGLKTIGGGLTLGITAPLTALAAASLKAFGSVESLKNGLTALTGSAQQANKQFESLKTLSSDVGVSLDDAAKASINLQTIGFSAERAEVAIRGIANAATLLGKGQDDINGALYGLQQLANTEFPLGEDLNILKERLPQVSVLLKEAFGSARSEDLQKMKITSAQVVDTIIKGLNELPVATKGLNASFEVMQNGVSTALAELGQTINETFDITGIVKDVTARVNDIVKAFSSLEPSTRKAIVIVAALAAAIGPLLLGLGSIISIAPLVGTAVTFMTGPIGIAIVAITAAAGAIYYYWDNIKKAVLTTIANIQQGISKFFSFISGIASSVGFDGISNSLKDLSGEFQYFSNNTRQKANEIGTEIKKTGTEISSTDEATKKLNTSLTNLDTTEKKATKTKAEYKRELTETLASMGYYDSILGSINYKYQDLIKLAKNAGASTKVIERLGIDKLGETLNAALSQISGVKQSELSRVKITPTLSFDMDALTTTLKNEQGKLKAPLIDFAGQLTEDVNNIIEQGVENSFASLASSIGEAMANGDNVLKAAGASLLGSLGSIMVELGTMAIKTGIGIKAIKTALETLQWQVALGAGLALVALGSAFKSGAGKLGKSMGSGGASGYSSNSVSSSSNAMPNYFQGAYSNNNTVVFEIEGSKLKGVLDRTNRKDNRTR